LVVVGREGGWVVSRGVFWFVWWVCGGGGRRGGEDLGGGVRFVMGEVGGVVGVGALALESRRGEAEGH